MTSGSYVGDCGCRATRRVAGRGGGVATGAPSTPARGSPLPRHLMGGKIIAWTLPV
jgi:hypothetical protein